MPPGMNRYTDDEVELAIELTFMCREFNVLPQPGGLLDQDYYLIRLLKAGVHGIGKLEERKRKPDQKG